MKMTLITFFLSLLLLNTAFAVNKKTIYLVMTVDWEGRSLEKHNLKAIQNFRKKFPEIPMLHFLNPAYYTKPDANPNEVTRITRSVLRPNDEHGLHIHPWKTLVEASGVQFNNKPDISGGSTDINCPYDCGHVVSLESAYNVHQLNKIFQTSIDILTSHGFKRPVSFRAGAWQTGPKVLQALADNSFYLDSSATMDDYVNKSIYWFNGPLVKSIRKLHSGITTSSQPYLTKEGLWQLPNNGSLADYTTANQLMRILKKNIWNFKRNDKSVHYITLGFHFETASSYLSRLKKFIPKAYEYTKRKNIELKWAHFPINLK